MQYTVKVKDYDGENKFQINNLRQKVIDAAAGEEIIFDQSDDSNTGHPLRIALYPDGAHLGGGDEYTAGVTIEGTPGHAGAKTKFTPPNLNFEAYIDNNFDLLCYYNSLDPATQEPLAEKRQWDYGDGLVDVDSKHKYQFGISHWYGAGVNEPSRTPPPEKDLHGTYFYYCENHRYMGGMIHYGSDSIPQGDGSAQPTVPAKYRLIDEGATASDAQDGDLTNNIVKTVEQYNELTTLWDYVWNETTTHSNPWAVQNTDTRNSVQYRIRYEVQDSAGVAATSRQKLINISATEAPTLPDQYIDAMLECDANADFDGYIYNDDHYVIRYVDFRTSNVSGTAVVHEFYVYGSFASSISDFGNSSHTFGSTTFYFIPAGASDLFKTNQCVGYIKVATQIVIPQVFQQAAMQLYTALKSAIQNHTLNSMTSNYTKSNSYRNYIHPQFCAAVDSRVDVWHKNAVITRKGNAVTNRGATANHLSIINGLSSAGFGSAYNNSAAGEEISIYPIRLS